MGSLFGNKKDMLSSLPDDVLRIIFADIAVHKAPNRRVREALLKREKALWQLRLECVKPLMFTGRVHSDRLWFACDRQSNIQLSTGWRETLFMTYTVPDWMPSELSLDRSPTHEELIKCTNIQLQVQPTAQLLELSCLSLLWLGVYLVKATEYSVMKVAGNEDGVTPFAQFAGLQLGADDYITITIDISCIPNKVVNLHAFKSVGHMFAQIAFVPLAFTSFEQCKAWNIC